MFGTYSIIGLQNVSCFSISSTDGPQRWAFATAAAAATDDADDDDDDTNDDDVDDAVQRRFAHMKIFFLCASPDLRLDLK